MKKLKLYFLFCVFIYVRFFRTKNMNYRQRVDYAIKACSVCRYMVPFKNQLCELCLKRFRDKYHYFYLNKW